MSRFRPARFFPPRFRRHTGVVPILRRLAADLPNSGVFNGTSQFHSETFAFDLVGKTILMVATVTGATTGTCAALTLHGAGATNYVELQAGGSGVFRGRFAGANVGQASSPVNPTSPGNVTANSFGVKTLHVIRVKSDDFLVTNGSDYRTGVAKSGGTDAMTTVLIGRGRATGYVAMTCHELQILDVTDDASVQLVANSMAATHGVAAPIFTPYINTTAVGMGDSITVGTGSSAGLNGWNEVAMAALLGKVGFNSPVTATADTQMSPYGLVSPADDAKIAAAFSNVTATAGNYTGKSMVQVMYGVNDFRRDVPLGTSADTTDATFWGAMNIGFANIAAQAPTLPVLVCITPPYSQEDTPNLHGLTLDDYRAAVRTKAAAIGATVCDFSGLWDPVVDSGTYTTDGLHPNDAGNALMGAYAATVIRAGVNVPV